MGLTLYLDGNNNNITLFRTKDSKLKYIRRKNKGNQKQKGKDSDQIHNIIYTNKI